MRPSINEELITQITNEIARGNTLRTAALLAGISETTAYQWRTRGRSALTAKGTHCPVCGATGNEPCNTKAGTPRKDKRPHKGRPPRNDDTLYAKYAEEVDKAIAQAEAFHVEVLRKAARNGSINASMFYLTRHPSTRDNWREHKQEVELTHVTSESLNQTLDKLLGETNDTTTANTQP